MTLNNIQATQFFDELRAFLAQQTAPGVPIELIFAIGDPKTNNNIPYIGVFDRNNPEAKPLILLSNRIGSGRRWTNELSPKSMAYTVVNLALISFDNKKEEWRAQNFDFQFKDAADFLLRFMREVSSFLYSDLENEE